MKDLHFNLEISGNNVNRVGLWVKTLKIGTVPPKSGRMVSLLNCMLWHDLAILIQDFSIWLL